MRYDTGIWENPAPSKRSSKQSPLMLSITNTNKARLVTVGEISGRPSPQNFDEGLLESYYSSSEEFCGIGSCSYVDFSDICSSLVGNYCLASSITPWMGDLVRIPSANKNFFGKSLTTSYLATYQNISSNKTLKRLKSLKLHEGASGQIIFFLLKVVALDIVRRFSRRKCHFVWSGIQALQVFMYPPLKWLQKWTPLKNLIKGMQIFSRPLLFLSMVTAFSEHSHVSKKTSDSVNSQQSEASVTPTTSDVRMSDEIVESSTSDNWLSQLHKDLESRGVTLPERITDDELQRFYSAADGDFSCLLQSIKRTIRWRETYTILSLKELESWSHLVFWHGSDMELRPCLVIRFGLAFSKIVPHDRPRFSQAIVSQIEHGVISLVSRNDPRITVIMDCEGLSPLGFPMQMMRSCSTLMQAHYPNRLASLFVVRVPPVGRVLMQTFVQILKPNTQQKLRIEGESTYKELLFSSLQSVPSFLGGSCTCSSCSLLIDPVKQINTETQTEASRNKSDNDLDGDSCGTNTGLLYNGHYEQTVRTALVGFLMVWIFLAFFIGMHDSDNLPLFKL